MQPVQSDAGANQIDGVLQASFLYEMGTEWDLAAEVCFLYLLLIRFSFFVLLF